MTAPPTAIAFEHVTRHFRSFASPVHRLMEAMHPTGKAFHTELPVLRDVTFNIPAGQTVAVLGANGTGKSTLLHIAAELLAPSSGSVTVHGTVFGLLDLGGSFAPELTGRENVRFFHEVVLRGAGNWREREQLVQDFAEIGEAYDRPVRTYSSGMFLRLAFAAAISAEPDILLIDEVIAVGDVRFQQKCYRRIRELHDRGTTILLVTHAVETVASLCDRVLLFDHGALVFDGDPALGVDRYYQLFLHAPDRPTPDVAPDQIRFGAGDAHILSAMASRDGHAPVSVVERGDRVTVTMEVTFDRAVTSPQFGISCSNKAGVRVYATSTLWLTASPAPAAAGERRQVAFTLIANVAVSDLFVDLSVFEPSDGAFVVLDARMNLLQLRITSPRTCEGIAELNATFAERRINP